MNIGKIKLPGVEQLAMILLGAGGLVLLVGLWLLWGALSGGGPSAAEQAARSSAAEIEAAIEDLRAAMSDPRVGDAARAALAEPEAGSESLRRALQAAGMTNLLDARAFPPNVEDIELGEYPEPDFTVIQLLLASRGDAELPAELHYPGTANENLALARMIPGSEEGEDAEPAGYLFVRLPASVVTRRVGRPDSGGWLAMRQGEAEVVGSVPADRSPDGRQGVAGTRLELLWGQRESADGPSLPLAGGIAMIGLLLLAAGILKRRETETGADDAREDAPAGAARPEAGATAGRPREAAPAEETRQDLPDWMLDDEKAGAGDQPFPPSARARSSPEERKAARPKADLGFEVPDLDEILEQIDAEEPDEERPQNDQGREHEATGKSGSAEPVADKQPEAGGLTAKEAENFDFAEDAFEEVDELPESDESELHDEAEGAGEAELDLDFAFSDAPEDSADELDEALAIDESEQIAWDDSPAPDSDAASPEASGAEAEPELEPEPEPEREPEREPEPEPEPEPKPEPEPEPKSKPEPKSAAASAARTGQAATASTETPRAAGAGRDIELPSGIFRPGDILGVVDEDLTARSATDVGQAIGSVAIERGFGRVAVARDGRFSGPILLSALIRGLRNSGLDVVEVGAVPTPLLWFAAAELADGCGVMVTGSHHPPKYNGFRVMIGGELLDPAGMADLARRCEQGDLAKGEGAYEQQDIIERYATRLSNDIQLERPLKVVVDCGNGVGGAVAPRLLEKIGADLIPLYCDVDGAFPNHRPDPSSPDDLEDLRLCVRNFQAELGIAFDGDADRLALVTKNGEIVWPDRLLMLLARDILATHPGEAVVFDVRCSGHLQRVVEHAGGRGVMTASGQQPVARRLREESAPLGGEMDGHLFINDRWYPFDDAIYAAARLLEMLAADTREVDEILAELPQFRASPEIVVATERAQTLELLDRLAGADFGDALVTRIDGVRADWSDRWGLARLNVDTGQMVLRFGADEATALGRVRSEFRDKLLELDPKLPLPY